MKKLIALLFCVSSLCFAATPINRIIAVVNSGVITQSQLANAMNFEKMRITASNIPMPQAEILKKQALQGLIIQTAALQMAQKNNLTVSDDTINNTISLIAQGNHSTVEGLFNHLKAAGISEKQYRTSIKNNLIIRKLEQRAIASNIMVTPDEIDNYLTQQKKSHHPKMDYNLAHILIALPASPTPKSIATASKKASMVYNKIQKGLNFKSAAAEYSDAGDAAKGGVLGLEPLSLLPTLFVAPAQKLKIGQVSKPFKSPTGFHIIKLLAKQSNGSQKHFVTQYKLQKILIKVSPVTSNSRAHTILNNLRTAVLNGKSFGKLARENSQDPITAANNGKTNWMGASELNQTTTAIVARLAKGQMSKPFKTAKGWMLIRLNGIRKHDDTAEYERQKAANAIFQKKAMEAVNTWRAQLKGESYIKVFK